MIEETIIALARSVAPQFALDAGIVCAVIEQESAGNTWAIRYEPAFRTRYVAPMNLPPTEEIARSCSWGLMQVMGEVAREVGFTFDLPSLCDPNTGITIGCEVLRRKYSTAISEALPTRGAIDSRALELWNGGGNPNYAAQVLARVPQYKS